MRQRLASSYQHGLVCQFNGPKMGRINSKSVGDKDETDWANRGWGSTRAPAERREHGIVSLSSAPTVKAEDATVRTST